MQKRPSEIKHIDYSIAYANPMAGKAYDSRERQLMTTYRVVAWKTCRTGAFASLRKGIVRFLVPSLILSGSKKFCKELRGKNHEMPQVF